jgi:hypothetical protein
MNGWRLDAGAEKTGDESKILWFYTCRVHDLVP